MKSQWIVLRVVEMASRPGEYLPVSGQYLETYDPEAYDGRGSAMFTPNLERAKKFESVADAMRTWREVPASRPLRDDGRPNRPLTSFTMEILPILKIQGTKK